MPKNKPCKALLKRIRITKTGRIKHRRAWGRHLRSHKSSKLQRSYRQPAYARGSEAKRVRAMLFVSVRAGDKGREATGEAESGS